MNEFDLKFTPLNEGHQNQKPVKDNSNKPLPNIDPNMLAQATEALEKKDYKNKSFLALLAILFGGQDKVITPTSDKNAVEQNAENFVERAKKWGVTPKEEQNDKSAESNGEKENG